jgi:hypothetical protein
MIVLLLFGNIDKNCLEKGEEVSKKRTHLDRDKDNESDISGGLNTYFVFFESLLRFFSLSVTLMIERNELGV